MFFLALDDALYGLEVSAGEFVRESEKWLILCFSHLLAACPRPRPHPGVKVLSHQEDVVLRIELYGREFCRHGRIRSPVRP